MRSGFLIRKSYLLISKCLPLLRLLSVRRQQIRGRRLIFVTAKTK
jgi:hypothetical protein